MQYVKGACSISCFSFMPFRMVMVLTLNQSSYAKHSILLRDEHIFLDVEGIRLQMELIGQGFQFHIMTLWRWKTVVTLFSHTQLLRCEHQSAIDRELAEQGMLQEQ